MKRAPVLAAVLGLAAATVFVADLFAQDARALEEAVAAVREAAADRNLSQTEAAYGRLMNLTPGMDTADEARLLLGKMQAMAGRHEDAERTVAPIVDREASPWHVKALYLTAESAAARRQWKRPADIYAKRVEWAAAEAHRMELASLYREIADGSWEGDLVTDAFGRSTRVPDWASARRFYEKARSVFVADGDRATISHRVAKSALESGDPEGAVAEWRALVEAGAGEFADDALYGMGTARMRQGRWADARTHFRSLREDHLDSPFAAQALIRIGESWVASGARGEEDVNRALESWRAFLTSHPDHEEASGVAWRAGELLLSAGRPREAIAAFADFLTRFPDDARAPEAQDRIAHAHLALQEFDKAADEWRKLLAKWPDHPLWATARGNIAMAAFAKAQTAYDEKRDADATAAFASFLTDFPADARSSLAQLLLGEIESRAGDHAAAVTAWELTATKYPGTAQAPAAALRVAETKEGPLADLPGALAAYERVVRDWPHSPQGQQARNILAQMKGRSLVVQVKRAFRTDEKPSVPVTLRNIPRLRMKAYKVDAHDYIVRKGSLDGVENVDVDIVKPDHEWDFDVPDFERYRLLDRTCPLPFKEPGAYIVRGADEELTATFLAVISDLTVIVKSASGQALCFVYDERTGEPVSGARVHLLDGDVRGVTGKDGVFQVDDGRVGPVRAVVSGEGAHKGHSAFTFVSPPGSSAFGYTPKCFLHTDRPLYRPGDTVHLRGIVRRVKDGGYVTEPGVRVPVTVTDPRGAVLFEKKLLTDAYGVIADDLDLAGEPSLGTYSIRAEVSDRTFDATFQVLAYKKPDVLVKATPEKDTYLAGDDVKVEVALRFTVGGNVAGAPVRWTVLRGGFTFDPSVHEAFSWFFRDSEREEELRRREAEGVEVHANGEGVTDGEGKVSIPFSTEAVEEDRTYTVMIEAQDPNRQWVRSAAAVPVTRRGAYVICRTEQKVYRPNEKVTLEVTTVDPLHSPLALEGEGLLVRLTRKAEHMVEEVVDRAKATTGADGRATVELRATKPGEYAVRFVTKDVRGNEVSGATQVTLSGDAEDLEKQAKLVADREFYREGDVAKVLVNVPVAPSPVLLTYEGEKVLSYRIYRAIERSSTVEIPLTAAHAPNVFLRMAVAKDGELYEDGDEVAVFQFLDVVVETDREEVRPGEKVQITVRTTDQIGRPVRAQVSVDVVDKALLQLAEDTTPQIKPFFYDQRRSHGVATLSSAGMRLPSVVAPTNKDLLFEQMRRLGREKFEEMERQVRLGRELLERGQAQEARAALGKALEIAPGNYEARSLLDSLDARDRLKDEARKMPASKPESGAAPEPPGASLRAVKRRGGGGKLGANRAGADKDAADDAPMEEAAEMEKSDMGAGGGSGGAFGGRNGGFARQDGDFRARAENVFDAKSLSGAVLALQAVQPMVPPELRSHFADTAFSSPRVETGADGSARVEFDLPDNITEWRVTARGAGQGPLLGEGRTGFRARKLLLVRADAPRFLTDGDTTNATGTVHSGLPEEVTVTVRFEATGMKSTGGADRTLTLGPGEVRPFDGPLSTSGHGLGKVRAEVLSSVESDAAEVAVPVIPYGLREIDGASGVLHEEGFADLVLPENAVDGTVSLTVTLSPSVNVSLLESLAYTMSYPWGCVEQTANRFLPALAAREALESMGSWDTRRKEQLDRTVERGLSALYALQADDGSFGWFGPRRWGSGERASGGSPDNTAYALLAMLRAERAGYRVSVGNRDRAIEAARRLAQGASSEDRAFLLYALAHAGQADLAELNRLHRERETLSARALALLTLTMHRTGRPGNATEGAQILVSRANRSGGMASWDATPAAVKSLRGWPHPIVDVEPTAYALLALLATDETSPLIDEAAAWISANRRGPAWRSTRDTAAAIEALAAWAKTRSVARAECEVQVFVGGGAEPVGSARFGGGARPVDAPVSIDVPASALSAGKNRVVLRKKGSGAVHWSALLAAVSKPKGDGPIAAGGTLVDVDRDYTEWVRPLAPGESPVSRILPGWSVVEPKHRPKDWNGRPLELAGVGDKVRVTLTVRSKVALDRVILEDPLPAGFEVVPDSAEGGFDREERRDDRQAFFFANVNRTARVSYVIQAIHPGRYRALPAAARPMYEPEIHGWSKEDRVTVDPEPGRVGRPPSPEEITPDEIWGLALRAFDQQDWASARSGFERLMKDYTLVGGVIEEAYWRLFVIGTETGDAELTVKSHEALVERNPRRAATQLGHRRALARSYQGLGEHERALVMYRDLGRELFAWDRETAEAFAQVGDPWRARRIYAAALTRQPDVSWVEQEELNLARATEEMRAALPVEKDAAGRPVRRSPGTSDAQPRLLHEAVAMYRSFQAHHADSGLAHQAGYRAVQALLAMNLSDETISEGRTFLSRHRKSPYWDDVTYLVAEGHFRAARYDDALAAARPLIEETFPDDNDPSRRVVSPLRSNAIHLSAKIAHLRGDLAKAVDLYRQVEGLFADARDAREFLTRSGLELREVESVPVGSTPRLHLRRKNVPEVRLRAYAVDFMILYTLRRNLSAVNRIDLSGVKPKEEWTVARRGPEDYRWSEEEIELPAREKGVYLVVADGGGLGASSVVLVSDLDVAVQETNGRLRIYTTRRDTGAPWGEVYVKVGDGNSIQAQGFTDARGVFEAGAVGGSFSVVAESDGHVALWRR